MKTYRASTYPSSEADPGCTHRTWFCSIRVPRIIRF